MGSQSKKAHKTHALAQPAGESYPGPLAGEGPAGARSTESIEAGFAKLCALVQDAPARAALLGIPESLEAAWTRGERLPLLRAHRKTLERALRAVTASARK